MDALIFWAAPVVMSATLIFLLLKAFSQSRAESTPAETALGPANNLHPRSNVSLREYRSLVRTMPQGSRSSFAAPVPARARGQWPEPDAADEMDEQVSALLNSVDCSVFAPRRAAPGETVVIQVAVHMPSASDDLFGEATDDGDDAPRRSRSSSSEAPFPDGTLIEARLSAPGLRQQCPIQYLIWKGDRAIGAFSVRVPDRMNDDGLFLRVSLVLEGVPLGSAPFRMPVEYGAQDDSRRARVPFRRYRSVFLSYSAQDRDAVMRHGRMLRLLGMRTFVDVLELRSADDWEERLQEAIERADVVLLYWSEASARSRWVLHEAEYAQRLQMRSGLPHPDIVPVILDADAPGPAAPQDLADLEIHNPARHIVLSNHGPSHTGPVHEDRTPARRPMAVVR